MSGFGMGFGLSSLMFTIVPILIGIGFIVVIGGMIVSIVRGIGTWSRNNQSPRLTVPAQVVSKRTDVTHHHHHHSNGMGHTSSSSWYYATFQVDSGDRMEFSLSGPEYGMLAEGDRGSLTFQGTRYLSFERT